MSNNRKIKRHGISKSIWILAERENGIGSVLQYHSLFLVKKKSFMRNLRCHFM